MNAKNKLLKGLLHTYTHIFYSNLPFIPSKRKKNVYQSKIRSRRQHESSLKPQDKIKWEMLRVWHVCVCVP